MSELRLTAAPRPSFVLRIFRTPLLTKLVLMDLVINVLTFVALQAIPPAHVQEVTVLSLAVVLVFNAALVGWALRPLQVLEDTARRVSDGEYTARTAMPRFADRNLVRIGATLDLLLDRVAHERARVRALAAEVVAAGDSERAHIARELHDGTAQSLTALEMLLSSLLTGTTDEPLHDRLRIMRDIADVALSEVRALAHSLHPRVLDDLGLGPAIEHVARLTREQYGLAITVHVDCPPEYAPSKAVASVFYRVAQEALHNIAKHARARDIELRFDCNEREATLNVRDDGIGFDRAKVESLRRGMGLFVMQERVALVDGVLDITSAPGRGTTVRVTVPVNA